VERLRALARRIGEDHADVREVRLYGSLARGERNPFADADLLIVVDRSDLPYRDRSPVYRPLGSPVPMDISVPTIEELEQEIRAKNPFVVGILRESIVLYERPSTERESD
jgi:predicted nucleotidyltransferase